MDMTLVELSEFLSQWLFSLTIRDYCCIFLAFLTVFVLSLVLAALMEV